MKERPILFSGDMVRAILAGRKNQTRRVVKPQPTFDMPDFRGSWAWNYKAAKYRSGLPYTSECPYGKVGDRLWVREKTSAMKSGGLWGDWSDSADARVEYLADSSADYFHLSGDQKKNFKNWENRPSIHMPQWASRITLEITNILVERLQDISEDDTKAEGAIFNDGMGVNHSGYRHDIDDDAVWPTAKQSFRQLWDRINGKKVPWSSNPWVWVIEFKHL